MFLQTLGSLILVVGVSYHLVTASWQVVLLSFVLAGVGYATWKVRKALIRRAKIKALWKRSIEIDEMLETMEREQRAQAKRIQDAAALTSSQERRNANKACVAFDGPARSSRVDHDNGVLVATDIVSESPWRAPKVSEVDPSTRIYKFSMKELANSREQKLQQHALV
jgi:hypothetical protein